MAANEMSHDPIAKIVILLVLAAGIALSIAWCLPAQSLPVDAPADRFSAGRAFQHLEVIANQPHPVGSPAQAQVRDVLLQQLTDLGLVPEVQQALGVLPAVFEDDSVAGRIENVVVRIPGRQSSGAILVLAHYDSVPGGSAAADNATGAAVLLELARLLSPGGKLQNDVILLFDDGEEYGFLGSQAFVDAHPYLADVRLAVSLDTAVSGPPVINQTGSQNGWLVRQFARANPRSVSNSLQARTDSSTLNDGTYDILPFLQAGIQGLALEDNYAFPQQHTALDQPDIVRLASVQQMGDQVFNFLQEVGNQDLAEVRSPEVAFFSLPGLGMVVYPVAWGYLLAVLAGLSYLAALFLGLRRSFLSWKGLAGGLLVALAAALSILLINLALWSVSRLLNPWINPNVSEVHPYHSPILFIGLFLLDAGLFSLLYAVARRRISLPDCALAALCLPFLLLVIYSVSQPGASNLVAWPLLSMAAAWCWLFARPPANGLASQWGLLLAAAFIVVLFFIPAILLIYMGEAWGGVTGWMLMIVLLLAFLVPQFDTLLQPKRWVFPGAILALAFVVLAVGLIAAGRYDQAHPWLDNLRYEYDANTGQASWVSEATRRDEWLAQIFPTDQLRAEAPVVDLSLPELEILDDQVENGIRTLHLRLAADPGVVRYRFGVQAGGAQPALAVNGQSVRLGVSPDGGWRTIDLFAPPAEGYELALQNPAGSPITIRLENTMLGLPAELDLPPRPENIASFGDSTTVRLDTILNP